MPTFEYTEEEFENLVNNVYLGNITPEKLPLDLYIAINLYLSSAVDRVFTKDIIFDIGTPELELYRYYQHNVAIFSGAKTYQQARDMSEAVFTADGMKRQFNAFRDDARDIFNTYNNAWLRTEYDTAVGQSQMGLQWADIERDAEALPYLRYVTARDERVRDEHKAWDGITLPVNHPFWQTHTPLNGWNCRCSIMQLDETEVGELTSEEVLKDLPEPEKHFKGNPAKTKKIFEDDHPYFNFNKEHQRYAENNFGFPTPPKPEPRKEEVVDTKVKTAKTLSQAEKNEVDFLKTLEEKEKKALFEYTNSTYAEINGYLRGDDRYSYLGDNDSFMNLINDLTETLKKSPKFETKTFRALQFNDRKKFDSFLKNLESGIFVEKGFMSTSTDNLSRFMDGKYRLTVEVEGKNGVLVKEMSINPDENEVLFNKGTSFEVVSIEKKYDYEWEEQAEYFVKIKEL